MRKNLSNKGFTHQKIRNFSGGFTLIELLVVIAIIALLASVVMASLTSTRQKSDDTAVKQNLNNARQQADLFFLSNNNSYQITKGSTTDVCSVSALSGNLPGIIPMLQAAAKAGGYSQTILVSGSSTPSAVFCASNGSSWAATAPLKNPPTGTTVYCVDSTRFGGAVASGTINADSDTTCL